MLELLAPVVVSSVLTSPQLATPQPPLPTEPAAIVASAGSAKPVHRFFARTQAQAATAGHHCAGPACGSTGNATIDEAVRIAASRWANPDKVAQELRRRLATSHTCYESGLSPQAYAELFEKTFFLPAGEGVAFDRDNEPTFVPDPGEEVGFFFGSGTVWGPLASGGNPITGSGQAQSVTLTYSFPADGVPWGSTSTPLPNDLSAELMGLFGAENLDRGREYFRQGLASQRRTSGLRYVEVPDDNLSFTTSTAISTLRGTIRIGSIPQGFGGVLAFNNFPSSGGDMTFNSDRFTVGPAGQAALFASSTSDFVTLRNTVSHEHGHGTGYFHVIPCNNTKLMEPFLNSNFNGLQVDDIRGAARNYGDRFAGNGSPATATNFGNLTSPLPTSVVLTNLLSLNGAAGPNGTNNDWFRFTVDTTTAVSIVAAPAGGTYLNAQQPSTGGCPGTSTSIIASQAGNIQLELFTADAQLVVPTQNANGVGFSESIVTTIPPGEYLVRVTDLGPNAAANQIVQLYNFAISIDADGNPTPLTAAPSNPDAIAGIDKRVAANTNAWFNGFPNSIATQAGAFITTFSWDLDGDGAFEVANDADPFTQYVSNGVYPATLRVTDSLGRSDTDTINVTVFGAVTTLGSLEPSQIEPETATPIVITGTNFLGVSSAAQVSFGPGIAVTGVPSVNARGTQITGLSVTFSGEITEDLVANLTITSPDGLGGSFSANGVLTVTAP
ncbi:MAG: hypothetical protein C0475_04190, partial [Planctomyces sp.]|nr:hypothetical protein [Planctomyces sp.]